MNRFLKDLEVKHSPATSNHPARVVWELNVYNSSKWAAKALGYEHGTIGHQIHWYCCRIPVVAPASYMTGAFVPPKKLLSLQTIWEQGRPWTIVAKISAIALFIHLPPSSCTGSSDSSIFLTCAFTAGELELFSSFVCDYQEETMASKWYRSTSWPNISPLSLLTKHCCTHVLTVRLECSHRWLCDASYVTASRSPMYVNIIERALEVCMCFLSVFLRLSSLCGYAHDGKEEEDDARRSVVHVRPVGSKDALEPAGIARNRCRWMKNITKSGIVNV